MTHTPAIPASDLIVTPAPDATLNRGADGVRLPSYAAKPHQNRPGAAWPDVLIRP
jgi:hypothetical protein